MGWNGQSASSQRQSDSDRRTSLVPEEPSHSTSSSTTAFSATLTETSVNEKAGSSESESTPTKEKTCNSCSDGDRKDVVRTDREGVPNKRVSRVNAKGKLEVDGSYHSAHGRNSRNSKMVIRILEDWVRRRGTTKAVAGSGAGPESGQGSLG